MMFRRLALALASAFVPVVASIATPAASAGTACANLAALTLPNVTVKSATAVPAGLFTPPPGAPGADGQTRVPVSMTLPAFCRVEATARPTSDSDIKFEVWIPPAEAWNGKFEG
ncbi:MAG: tannase/feruloyl esterase family alpha/beta hydrolase, partial [Vicinamibacterales bacterium]